MRLVGMNDKVTKLETPNLTLFEPHLIESHIRANSQTRNESDVQDNSVFFVDSLSNLQLRSCMLNVGVVGIMGHI